MKHLLYVILMSPFVLALSHCGPSQQEILQKEVLKVHDEVMPKMDDINRLKKGLIKKYETMKADTASYDIDQAQLVERSISHLKEADESMMNWMRDFKPAPGSMSDEDYLSYLEGQKKAITKVKEDMMTSISEAESLLE